MGVGGGWVRRQTKVCVPNIGLIFPAPLINFILLPKETFSDVGKGGGSAGAGHCPKQPPPPRDL